MTGAAGEPAPHERPSTGHDSTTTPDPPTGCGVTHTTRGAATVALEALEERARASRLLLTDRTLHGLADPNTVRRGLVRDEEAIAVLLAARGL